MIGAQKVVDLALTEARTLGKADETIVLVTDRADAALRWAGNSMTTNGELVGQVRDAAYQATTTDFWGAMEAVGGPQTWQLGGASNCGKAQPGQVAPVSHGCPTALFRDIRILNTTQESGR